ncbi:Dihydrofolate reductase [compost metagenome]
MSISFIFAMDRNGAIGKDNKMPWHIPADLKFFKKVTNGHSVLMGRKTYESIGKPLPGRTNIIMTQNQEYSAEGCEVVHTIAEVQQYYKEKELFVIGGAEIFRLYLPVADRLYITFIEQEFEADTFFNDIDLSDWDLVSSEQGPQDEKNPYEYHFRIFDKKRARA